MEIGSNEQEEYTYLGGGGNITSIIPGFQAQQTLVRLSETQPYFWRRRRSWTRTRPAPVTPRKSDGDWVPETVEGAKGTRMTLGSGIRGEDQTPAIVCSLWTAVRLPVSPPPLRRLSVANANGRLNGVYVESSPYWYRNVLRQRFCRVWYNAVILPVGTVAGWHEFSGATMSNRVVCVTSAADRLVVNARRNMITITLDLNARTVTFTANGQTKTIEG